MCNFFHNWCVHVIPLIYDDSLTLYESFCKFYRQLEILRKALEETQEQVEINEKDIADLNTALTALTERVTTAENNITKNTGDIAKNANDISTNASNIAKNAADITKINSTIDDINTEINSINAILNAHTSSISSINDSIGQINTKITTIQNRLTTAETNISNNQTAIANNVTEINAIKTDVNELSGEVANNSADITELKNRPSFTPRYIDMTEFDDTKNISTVKLTDNTINAPDGTFNGYSIVIDTTNFNDSFTILITGFTINDAGELKNGLIMFTYYNNTFNYYADDTFNFDATGNYLPIYNTTEHIISVQCNSYNNNIVHPQIITGVYYNGFANQYTTPNNINFYGYNGPIFTTIADKISFFQTTGTYEGITAIRKNLPLSGSGFRIGATVRPVFYSPDNKLIACNSIFPYMHGGDINPYTAGEQENMYEIVFDNSETDTGFGLLPQIRRTNNWFGMTQTDNPGLLILTIYIKSPYDTQTPADVYNVEPVTFYLPPNIWEITTGVINSFSAQANVFGNRCTFNFEQYSTAEPSPNPHNYYWIFQFISPTVAEQQPKPIKYKIEFISKYSAGDPIDPDE